MAKPLFREKALEKLASPENLHEIVRVTSPRSWLGLMAIGLVLSFGLAWSILGTIPKTVRGQGILIQAGGLAEVRLLATGIVNQIWVAEGQKVSQGDTLAEVAQPELQLQIDNARETISYLKAKRTKIIQAETQNRELQEAFTRRFDLEEQNNRIQRQIRTLEEQGRAYARDTKDATQRNRINQTQRQLLRLQRQLLVQENEIQKLDTQTSSKRLSQAAEFDAIQQEIKAAQRTLDELLVKYSLSAYVKSPYQGKVVELLTKKGQLLEVGAAVITVEVANQAQSNPEAIIYVSPEEGKRVQKGMTVRLDLSTVKAEEYGYLIGKVRQVSEYPASRQGMVRVLGNPDLVQTFSRDESPIAVSVQLQTADTPSGYQWTSQSSPKQEIKAGTLCEANIVVRRQSPLSLLVPYFE